MEEFDVVGIQAHDATASFLMALNGAFFTTRKPGIRTLPCQIEIGKRNIQTASYIFINSLKSLINIYDRSRNTQVTQDKLTNIAEQLARKANKALMTGIGSSAAAMLGNKAHGAIGELVARSTQSLDLSVKDSSGRTWKDPAKLVQTIVRDYLYQQEVELRISQLKDMGELYFVVGDEVFSLKMFDEVRARLFHPNSKNLPERFLSVQTQP